MGCAPCFRCRCPFLLPSNSRSTAGDTLLLFSAAGEGRGCEPRPRATPARLQDSNTRAGAEGEGQQLAASPHPSVELCALRKSTYPPPQGLSPFLTRQSICQCRSERVSPALLSAAPALQTISHTRFAQPHSSLLPPDLEALRKAPRIRGVPGGRTLFAHRQRN